MPKQLAHDADVEKPEHSPATEHKSRPAVTDIATIEKIELLLGGYDLLRQLGEKPQSIVYFLNVLLDQYFRSRLGLPVENAFTHSPHVAVDALIQGVEQPLPILLLAKLLEPVQAIPNLGVIVELRGLFLPPFCFASQRIVSPGC